MKSSARAMCAFFIIITIGFLLAACASIGRPEGGPRDVTAPVYVRSNPKSGACNFNNNKVEVWFDENIQLDDAFNKVIVSPAQKQAAVVRSLGKRVYVELRDTLIPNTTYTIDFADAIKDLNEGNILDGFAIDFSTGDTIDTLRLSGIVLEARTLEPAQGMTVGIYTEPVDSTLSTVPFERLARTNQYGQFTVRNLKPGKYGVYALNDLNRDNHWDRSEDVAFLGSLVTPYVESIMVNDTLRDVQGNDSIATRPGVAYFPNDLLLTWFNEDYKSQYLRDHARPERHKITLGMAAPADSLPTLTIVGGDLNGQNILDHARLQKSPTNDSLTYWLRSPEILAIDSLLLDVRHQFTDTLDQIAWKNDTIRFFWREPKKKKEDKKDKDGENDSIPKIEFIGLQVATSGQHDVYAPLRLHSNTPFERIDTTGFHLEMMVDSVWTTIPFSFISEDNSNSLMETVLDFDRKPGEKYRFSVDSLAVTDIYGLWNKPLKHEFTVRPLEEYANLIFKISGADSIPVIVELLDGSEKTVRTIHAENGVANIKHINPGDYYARLFLDADSNGVWTTGNIAAKRQPEEVYYYPGKLKLKANWDIEQAWDIYKEPVDTQKPHAIKKNKPKLKAGEKDPHANDEVEYDEWGEPIDPNDNNYRNGSRNNNRNNGFGGLGGLTGGRQTVNKGTNYIPR